MEQSFGMAEMHIVWTGLYSKEKIKKSSLVLQMKNSLSHSLFDLFQNNKHFWTDCIFLMSNFKTAHFILFKILLKAVLEVRKSCMF